MSLLCLCVVENYEMISDPLLDKQIKSIAEPYNRGIKFGVDWVEPIVSYIKRGSLIVSINDNPLSDNREMFLLPDGWYSNCQTNAIPFRSRMVFLQDLATMLINQRYNVSFYIAESGTDLSDFHDVSLKCEELPDYLLKTIGASGVSDGVRINMVP